MVGEAIIHTARRHRTMLARMRRGRTPGRADNAERRLGIGANNNPIEARLAASRAARQSLQRPPHQHTSARCASPRARAASVSHGASAECSHRRPRACMLIYACENWVARAVFTRKVLRPRRTLPLKTKGVTGAAPAQGTWCAGEGTNMAWSADSTETVKGAP